MTRKVKFIRFHQSVHTPAAGELGNVLPPSSKTFDNLVMTLEDQMIYVSYIYNNKKIDLAWHSSNASVIEVLPPETPMKVVKASLAS